MGAFEFSGNYTHNIDPKGRVTIPAPYRDGLGEDFTIGLNNDFTAIALYPAEKWASIGQALDRIPDSDRRAMAYVRQIKAFSFTNQKLDAQGRVLLPQVLRDKVSMVKEIRFVGVGRFLELWDEARFVNVCTETEESIDSLLDYVDARYNQHRD